MTIYKLQTCASLHAYSTMAMILSLIAAAYHRHVGADPEHERKLSLLAALDISTSDFPVASDQYGTYCSLFFIFLS